MARIKVTGYIETDNMPDEFLDSADESGLSSAGYDALLGIQQVDGLEHEGNLSVGDLDDVEFTKA